MNLTLLIKRVKLVIRELVFNFYSKISVNESNKWRYQIKNSIGEIINNRNTKNT